MSARDPLWFDLDGVAFGDGRAIKGAEFNPDAAQLTVGDVPAPGGSGLVLGRDHERGAVWSWRLMTVGADERTARAIMAPLETAWRASTALAPGSTQALRYTMAGRTRRVYGRSRKWSPIPGSPVVAHGVGEVVCDFMVTDPLFYDDAAQSVQLGMVPASMAGLVFPTAPPFTWRTSGTPQVRAAVVGGDAPTPLSVTFRGPVTRPWVQVGSLRVDLTGTLAYDQAVTVDARTRTCLWTAGRSGSAAGLLGPRVRLAELTLPPGVNPITFGGTDTTGTATATITWRNAWRSL